MAGSELPLVFVNGGVADYAGRLRSCQEMCTIPRMPDKLLGRIGDFLDGRKQWYELPRLLAMPMLVEIRNRLRRENLHDTEEPALEQKPVPPDLDPALRNERTVDG